jgi:hypothetical protein
MTPKEKAIELVEQFASVLMHDEVYEDSIKCALIAIDEIIKYTKEMIMIYDLSFDVSDLYWIQVKQEIEKL